MSWAALACKAEIVLRISSVVGVCCKCRRGSTDQPFELGPVEEDMEAVQDGPSDLELRALVLMLLEQSQPDVSDLDLSAVEPCPLLDAFFGAVDQLRVPLIADQVPQLLRPGCQTPPPARRPVPLLAGRAL
ncbi:hypothetical protein C7C46_09690 [Streptomyces tateyamensis]|uniref:Uncharacterized protein n=1 Tax=Streptomyces tateyamensis TaxID=565073 RepID=A0A2V4NJX1_9ACTN|nr:hypothetical protein C7C46_09690 [Streptomyces tateyamensis]